MKRSNRIVKKSTLLGLAFDAEDGHKRITRGDNFLLCGGSEETHGVMQETAIKFDEALERKGKALREATLQEILDLFHEAQQQ